MRIELFNEIVSSSRFKYICLEGIARSSFLDSTKFKEIRLLGVKREALFRPNFRALEMFIVRHCSSVR